MVTEFSLNSCFSVQASLCACVISGDQKRGLLVSQEELPEEEQLYQPLASADKVDHDYAQIIACPSQDHGKIPTMVGGGVQSSRRATIGSPYPVQQSTRQSSAIPHQESVMAPHVAAPRLPLNRSMCMWIGVDGGGQWLEVKALGSYDTQVLWIQVQLQAYFHFNLQYITPPVIPMPQCGELSK